MKIDKRIIKAFLSEYCYSTYGKVILAPFGKGLTVIPTVSWSTPRSFEFCFDGIEKGSIVAVGTLGCKNNKRNFMRGYNEMLERIKPSKIIVFDKPFPEMTGEIVYVDYLSSRKGGKINGRKRYIRSRKFCSL